MKKSFFFAALMMVAAMFTACNSGSDPLNDSTKLWPACDAKGERWGYMDASGVLTITPMYDHTSYFCCGYGRAVVGSNYFFLDKNGKTSQGTLDLSEYCDEFFYNNCLRYRVNGLYGMLDNSFNPIIQPLFGDLGTMTKDGLVLARMHDSNPYDDNDEKFGYVNSKGEFVINPTFEYASDFVDGVAAVSVGEKWGAINTKGEYAFTATYDRLRSLGEGLLAFVSDKNAAKVVYGIIDTKGTVIVPEQYDNVKGFADNALCPVCKDDKWGYIDNKGALKIGCNFYQAAPFYDGYAWILRTEDSKYELIGTDGSSVLTLGEKEVPVSVFEHGFHNGLCRIKVSGDKSDTYKYIDSKGTTVYSWTIEYNYPAPARVMGERKMNIAEMFAATPYGPRFMNK